MLRLFSLALGHSISRSPVKNSVKALMQKLLAELMAEPRAWAFLHPVDSADVVDYYDVIKNPMGMFLVPTFAKTP
jgi:hypothetical protein